MTDNPAYAIVLDFEATCDEHEQPRPQEIIEFPSIIVSLQTLETIDEFRQFVKPYHNPVLTEFCKTLTSIRQSDVDAGQPFKKVFEEHQKWLEGHGITDTNAVFVTCGDWDLGTMLPSQCASAVPGVEVIPSVYLRWHNIKKSYCVIRQKEKATGMAGMLRDLGLALTGHHHCGIDDCRNIKALLTALVKQGAQIDFTAELPVTKYPPITLQLHFGEQVEQVVLTSRCMKSLIGIAGKVYKRRFSGLYTHKGDRIDTNFDLIRLVPGEEIILRE